MVIQKRADFFLNQPFNLLINISYTEQVYHPEDHQALMMATSLHQGTVIRVVDSAGEPIRKKGSIDFFAMGGDINCTNDLLQTPLHIAISVGNNMVVKQLLDKRSEINLSVSEKCSATYLYKSNYLIIYTY